MLLSRVTLHILRWDRVQTSLPYYDVWNYLSAGYYCCFTICATRSFQGNSVLSNHLQVFSWSIVLFIFSRFLVTLSCLILTLKCPFICGSVLMKYFLKLVWTLLVGPPCFWDLWTTLYNRIPLWVFELRAFYSSKIPIFLQDLIKFSSCFSVPAHKILVAIKLWNWNWCSLI